MKVCKKCNIEKALDNFYRRKSGIYHSLCKSCFKLRTNRLYHLHKNDPKYKERKRANAKSWRASHKKQVKAWNDNLSNEYVLVKTAKRRAKEYNLPFDLKIEDIHIPELCPILKIPLIRAKNVHTANSPSIDRIEPKLGYVIDNIQIISHKANAMKNNATSIELLEFSKWINYNYAQTLPKINNKCNT